MKQLWIGVVEVLTEADALDGDTRAFTNVVAWAETASDYAKQVEIVFEEYGRTVLGFERVRPIDHVEEFDLEITEIIEQAKGNPQACIFGTFYSYPSKPM